MERQSKACSRAALASNLREVRRDLFGDLFFIYAFGEGVGIILVSNKRISGGEYYSEQTQGISEKCWKIKNSVHKGKWGLVNDFVWRVFYLLQKMRLKIILGNCEKSIDK